MAIGGRLVVTTFIAFACASAGAQAAPTWLAPFVLNGPQAAKSNGGGSYTYSMIQSSGAMDDDGDLFVVNREYDGANYRMAVVERLRDGTTHKQLVSPAGSDVDLATSPQIAVAGTGAVIVAWK